MGNGHFVCGPVRVARAAFEEAGRSEYPEQSNYIGAAARRSYMDGTHSFKSSNVHLTHYAGLGGRGCRPGPRYCDNLEGEPKTSLRSAFGHTSRNITVKLPFAEWVH